MNSSGYFALQEAHQVDGGAWTWHPLQARGSTAISIVSYALTSISTFAHLIQYSNSWISGQRFDAGRLPAGV